MLLEVLIYPVEGLHYALLFAVKMENFLINLVGTRSLIISEVMKMMIPKVVMMVTVILSPRSIGPKIYGVVN